MRYLAIGVLSLAVVFLIVQVINFSFRVSALSKDDQMVQERLDKASATRDQLQAQLMGYDQSENVEQKAREQFNYRRPDEKMLIIIPPRESATSTNR